MWLCVLRNPRPVGFLLLLGALFVLPACSSVADSASTAPPDPTPTVGTTLTPTAGPQPTATEVPAATATGVPTATATPTPTPSPTPTPTATPIPVDPIAWTSCEAGQCASVFVPIDHDDASSDTLTVSVSRVQASSPDERIGSLFLNFGGPGAGAASRVKDHAATLPEAITSRFDIVGVDPRGTGGSGALTCPASTTLSELYDADDGLADEVDILRDQTPDWLACTDTPALLDHLGTVATARDIDAVRRAMGEETISWLGYSYGTQLGWVLATLFPETVRAMILDAPVSEGKHSPDGWLDQAENFEDQLTRIDALCDQAGDCAVADEGFRATVVRLVEELGAEPVIGSETLVDDARLLEVLTVSLYLAPADVAPQIAERLALLDNDNASIGDLLPSFGDLLGGYNAITCADGAGFNTTAEFEDYVTQRLDRAEILGQSPDAVLCDTWPGVPVPPPAIDTSDAPPILVVAGTEDPATPYANALLLMEQLAEAELLTWVGGGHGIVGDDDCIDRWATDYLVDLTLPPEGSECLEARGTIGLELSGDGDDGPGMPILSVAVGSAGEDAGIEPGDVLLTINGKPIEEIADVPVLPGGTEVTVGIEREGQAIDLDFTLDSPPWT